MIRKMVGEVTGLSDVGKIIDKEDYGLVQADDYIFHEDNETIHYVIKSLKDEYCFTNLAIIHVDGESALSSKRLVKRYTYKYNTLSKVFIESAGNLDRDCEIKFNIKDDKGQVINLSIDVDKQQIEQLKDLYKALTSISHIQKDAANLYNTKLEAITATVDLFRNNRNSDINTSLLEDVINLIETKKLEAYNEARIHDFGDVFTRYIEN